MTNGVDKCLADMQEAANEAWEAKRFDREFKAYLLGSKTYKYPTTQPKQASFLNGLMLAYKTIHGRVVALQQKHGPVPAVQEFFTGLNLEMKIIQDVINDFNSKSRG